MAAQYYANYGKYVGFDKMVTAENAQAIPDYMQYVGKVINAVEPNVLIGAYRFPKNDLLREVEPSARIAWLSGPYTLDAILFGHGRVQ
jgi:hypothetical protein